MSKPSTRALDALPAIEGLLRLSQALAMLDAILCPEWEYRTYSFNARWAPGQMMASMRNGSGDDYFILFSEPGTVIKGFDHESVMSRWSGDVRRVWPGIYDGIPDELASFLDEPAFSVEDVTFCVWRRAHDARWHRGPVELPAGIDPDGSGWMLGILDGDPETYRTYAREYFEVDVSRVAVERVYALSPLTDELIGSIDRARALIDVEADAAEIGYPR